MSATDQPTSSRWIRGAGWDSLVCLSTLWFPVAFLAVWKGSEQAGLAAREVSLAAFMFGVSIPHFLTTFTFTYMDPDQRAYYRSRRGVYYGIPLLLVVGSWLYSASIGPAFLVTVWLLFGEHHVAAQNIGFAALYRARNREGEVDRRIDHLVFNTAWITTVAIYATRQAGDEAMQYLSRPTLAVPLDDRAGVLGALTLLAIGAFSLYLGRQGQRLWRGQPVSVPKLLFMLTTWPSFLLVPYLVRDVDTAVILRSGYHSVQYLGLVLLLNERRCAARAAPDGSLLRRLVGLGPAGYLGLHVAAALAVWFATDIAGGRPGFGNDVSLRYLFFPGFALAHFFLDGLTWRLGSEHGRRTVVPFLAPMRAETARVAA